MHRLLFQHWSQVPDSWMAIAPNFSFEGDPKMVSADTGAFLFDPLTLTLMQGTRDIAGHSLRVNSWYRSPLLNARTRGAAPLSQHVEGRAVDISTRGRDREHVYLSAMASGWTSFGFYETFIHVGTSGKRWFGSQRAKKLWAPILHKPPTIEI